MDKYILMGLLIPVVWFLCLLTYEISKLFYLWSKDKISSIKEKEFQLWD